MSKPPSMIDADMSRAVTPELLRTYATVTYERLPKLDQGHWESRAFKLFNTTTRLLHHCYAITTRLQHDCYAIAARMLHDIALLQI